MFLTQNGAGGVGGVGGAAGAGGGRRWFSSMILPSASAAVLGVDVGEEDGEEEEGHLIWMNLAFDELWIIYLQNLIPLYCRYKIVIIFQ
jgi:hypothetical protein